MGFYTSRLHYEQPLPDKPDKDPYSDNFQPAGDYSDQTGFHYCRNVAVKNGLGCGFLVAVICGTATYYYSLRTKNVFLKALFNRPPGIALVVTCTGYGTYMLLSELILHDCSMQRAAYLQEHTSNTQSKT